MHLPPWSLVQDKALLSAMRSTLTILGLLVSSVSSQLLNFAPGNLPACAQSCQTLQNAQTVCVPPAAPATGQLSYQSCFCQSAYLTTLRQSSAGICDTSCPNPTDATQIQKWYINLCNNGVGAAVSSSSAISGATSTAPAAAAQPAPTSDNSMMGTNVNAQKPTW